MTDHQRHSARLLPALRSLADRYGPVTAVRLLVEIRAALRAGEITEADAVAILDALRAGDLSTLADHPAYAAAVPRAVIDPDGLPAAYFDPDADRRAAAVTRLGHAALTTEDRPAPAAHLRLRLAAIAAQRLRTTARRPATRRARTPERIEPTATRDSAALVAAARPGPVTGV